jgi:hypothetical protein
MDRDIENKWLMDSSCSIHITSDKKWYSGLTPLSHKEYVTFGDDKKGKMFGASVIKVNNHFTLKDDALVKKFRLICSLSLNLLMLIWAFFFANLVLKFMIPAVTLLVVFLALGRFFKMIFLLLKSL